MTDRDKIELPLLPRADFSYSTEAMERYGRAAVLADRERRAKQEAKPVVLSRTLRLTDGGNVYREYESEFGIPGAIINLRWTTDGKAWIESEQNREQAAMLRKWGYHGAADALDGGERFYRAGMLRAAESEPILGGAA